MTTESVTSTLDSFFTPVGNVSIALPVQPETLLISDGDTISFTFPDDSTDSATWSLVGSSLGLVGGTATATIAALPVGSVVEAFTTSVET